ncbi:glycosyltransferase family 2 protein [Amycolatopsis sp., V23-08]|uniref:Glycosyltransferase family 2 protein n=1 Tax=Amycolatopsis heterodermiae TaxID=3110235 RepID=A0ABU5R5R8_9PSEU|nr:glycosyltransferase family 2 protein [Amycolatopsis sp., V23-08]MEA5361015.1 glycosyltransferase family 2 protein [Amycolatopsis sp., V23-08]
MSGRTTVVVATRNRAGELARTLTRLSTLDPAPPVVVLDNASADGTAAVAVGFPGVRLIRLPRNLGAAARTLGVLAAETPYVAFSDDDSWWAPGALTEAERIFDAHPRTGLLAARTLVGPEEHDDPVTPEMERSPLGHPEGAPGPLVLGFLACSAIVRRTAYLEAGGFSPLLHFGAEEQLLAYDLAARGWESCFAGHLRAHHHPSVSRPPSSWRRRAELRNRLLITVLRRPWPEVFRTLCTAPAAGLGAVPRVARALRGRQVLPEHVENQAKTLERTAAWPASRS